MIKDDESKISSISFSEFWPKLQGLYPGKKITTIRPFAYESHYSDMMKKDHIRIILRERGQNEIILATATLDSMQTITLSELSQEAIEEDTYPHWNLQTLLVCFRKFYGRKSWWKEANTKMLLLTLTVKDVLTR